jgi:hypothetical protein
MVDTLHLHLLTAHVYCALLRLCHLYACTAVAAPHIAGVAAVCIASGECSAADGFANAAVLQAAAKQRLAVAPSYGFDGDARRTSNGKYYGYLAWDKW